jgi:hypothetical protein
MATTILKSNCNDEISTIMSRQFIPRLNIDDDSNYYPSKMRSNINSIYNENNTFNKMSFLFPSIPKEVSIC